MPDIFIPTTAKADFDAAWNALKALVTNGGCKMYQIVGPTMYAGTFLNLRPETALAKTRTWRSAAHSHGLIDSTEDEKTRAFTAAVNKLLMTHATYHGLGRPSSSRSRNTCSSK